MPGWVEQLCAIASMRRTSNASIRQLFEQAAPDLTDRRAFLTAVTQWLQQHPDLVDDWDLFSVDQRSSAAPYFSPGDERTSPVVGFFSTDHGHQDITHHSNAAEACADYLYRESCLVLLGQQVH